MSAAKHTKGKLIVGYRKFSQLLADNGALVATCNNIDGLLNRQANAARLVACWNACEGIETYALEMMTGELSIEDQLKFKPKKVERKSKYRAQRDALLAVLQELIDIEGPQPGTAAWADKARAAIAKATGSAT